MKQELYHYATSIKNQAKGISNIPNICIWILLMIFSMPILMLNIWFWLILFISYIALFFCSKKEKDEYAKMILKMGSFMFYLGIVLCYSLMTMYRVSNALLYVIFIILCIYELSVVIKLKLKRYSHENKNSKKIVDFLTIICGTSGIWLGRFLGGVFRETSWIIWITVALCALIVVGSITYFQKLAIYKIIKE